jgi:hypothetical protein
MVNRADASGRHVTERLTSHAAHTANRSRQILGEGGQDQCRLTKPNHEPVKYKPTADVSPKKA